VGCFNNMTIHTAQDGPTPLTAASSSTSKACVPRNLSGASTDLWVVMRGEEGRWMARAPALSGRFHPQFRDRNRRDIGKSQSIWTNSKMETPSSPPWARRSLCSQAGADLLAAYVGGAARHRRPGADPAVLSARRAPNA
jgi:hypothetical protein